MTPIKYEFSADMRRGAATICTIQFRVDIVQHESPEQSNDWAIGDIEVRGQFDDIVIWCPVDDRDPLHTLAISEATTRARQCDIDARWIAHLLEQEAAS